MLCGRPPFYGKTDEEIIKKIQGKSYSFNYPEWNKVSTQVKELIQSIFVNPDKRPTSQEILDHPWLTELAPQSTEELLNLEWDKLLEYTRLNKLQKSVISFASFRLKDEDTKTLSEIFKSIDKNSDGVLTISEIKDGFVQLQEKNSLSITEEEFNSIFTEMDLDKNGLINYNEFITATVDYRNVVKQEHIYEAFRNFDSDKSGKLSLKELAEVIKPQTEDDVEYLKSLFKKYDVNNDGEIDWEEFLKGLDLSEESSTIHSSRR
jgi:calcium-dependent protein kinase